MCKATFLYFSSSALLSELWLGIQKSHITCKFTVTFEQYLYRYESQPGIGISIGGTLNIILISY